jgi:hypothetical protein
MTYEELRKARYTVRVSNHTFGSNMNYAQMMDILDQCSDERIDPEIYIEKKGNLNILLIDDLMGIIEIEKEARKEREKIAIEENKIILAEEKERLAKKRSTNVKPRVTV